MNRIACVIAAAAWFLLASAHAAATDSPDDVLVENSHTKLTRGDYEADLLRLPADMRNALAADPKRLTVLLNNMLVAKTLAAEARAEGADRDPQIKRLIALETDRALSQVQIQRIEDAAGAEFEAKSSEFLLKARERYRGDEAKYRLPEQVKVAQMFFDPKKDGPEAALARAKDARKKLLAGADFNELAKELSDDPLAKNTGGESGWLRRDRLDPDFTAAAFAMNKPGEISEPVHTRFGYLLIRYEDRRPPRQVEFDEVKDSIMADLRKDFVKERREAKLAAIRNDPNMKIDQKAVDALVYQPDPSLFKPTPPATN